MNTLSVGIGILAYNEQDQIEVTLESLFQQCLFKNQKINGSTVISEVEVIVVPNGCSDSTATIASAELNKQISRLDCKRNVDFNVHASVHEIEAAGKSNAWNIYTHELSGKHLDLIVMLDADIEFNEEETITNSIKTLLENEDARVVVDTPLKSLHTKPDKTILDRISLLISRQYLGSRIGVAGSFYCAATSTLRQIWMPVGLPGEDGFLKAMIITDMFRSSVDQKKIVRAENASHYYVPETSISGILKHELRSIIGTSINCYLTWDFLLFATDPKGPGAGVVLRNLITKNPDWLRSFLENTTKNKGYWVIPRGTIFANLYNLKGKNIIRDFKTYVVVGLRTVLNLCICLVANHKLRKGQGLGYW